jgi:GH15 family glucan-1,4-alpha-glucosidase
VDWLCVPSFDSPSVFGSLLDRQAGNFRFGPYGVNHPVTRAYEPGTHVLRSTWRTPTGWGEVRDALTIYPGKHKDEVTRHTRPPTDEDADHMLVRTVECLEGHMQVELICEPTFDYGRVPARWELDEALNRADASGAGVTVRLASDLPLGVEGERVRGRRVLQAGEKAFCALSWAADRATPANAAEASAKLDATANFWRSWIARSRVARGIAALSVDGQGLDLHAHGGLGGGADDLATRNPGRATELGLPLHLDARRDVHAEGVALPEPRLGGRRVHAVHRRP